MKCPSCNTNDLIKSQREGFEIDQCPACNGVWLQRNELNKITARLYQDDQSPDNNNITGTGITNRTDTGRRHSPIMKSIEASRELHQLHMSGNSKQHWMHRLFG